MRIEDYVKAGVSPYHTAAHAAKTLQEAGFEPLAMGEPWQLARGGRYVTMPFAGMLYAFCIGDAYEAGGAMRLACAHTDTPCLHVKPAAETAGDYPKLNVEVYGGPILNTWLDRPLGIAGRVVLRSEEGSRVQLLQSATALLVLPNLPIHFNREVNKGMELKPQTDMQPILGSGAYEKGYFTAWIAKECGCESGDILDFDLYLYNAEAACSAGLQGELCLAPRLDNQTSCYALLRGICHANVSEGLSVIALYDNEEVGSHTKQGADSALFGMLLEKIYDGLGYPAIRLKEAIVKSMLVSADVAHALHPNHPERYDRENSAKLGDGIVIKLSSGQRYAYDAEAVGEAVLLCEKNGIPYKKHVNHSDRPGGSTMGPLLSSWLPMKTLDVGVPILAMHSASEVMCYRDQEALTAFVTAYLSR